MKQIKLITLFLKFFNKSLSLLTARFKFYQKCFAFKASNEAITFIIGLISASSAVELFPLELSDPILDRIEDNRQLNIMFYTFYYNISVG